ncbi:MAG: dihydrolipoamide acetyltransferase family protein [Steroidobacteraceae bacterium]
MASPATRRRAREAGIDLATVAGSGPGGRILAGDISARLAGGNGHGGAAGRNGASAAAADEVQDIPVIGVRRLIAQRMSEAKRNIPHFAYVEEVDVTDLEALRLHLNGRLQPGQPSFSYLPFIVAALVPVLREFPQCNAHYDEARNVVRRHRAVHVGIATQTPDGLKVPVLRHAERRALRELALEIRRVSEAARNNTARRDELTGSTITVTSLGKLGGIVSTPILNAPEVAIIGINKAVERVVVRDGNMVIRRIMNLSSSFDHRFVDGFDAAAMIQALKEKLEHPATIFTD